jgi:hypothetical protein
MNPNRPHLFWLIVGGPMALALAYLCIMKLIYGAGI